MWLLSGCVVTPIEAQDGSTPVNSSATIAIAPIAGEPGDLVFVSGAGWASNESVYVNLEQTPDEEPIQTTVAIANTDSEGRFTVTFPYPIDPVWREPGMIDVVAYSVRSNAQAVAPYEVLESEPLTEEPATATPLPTAAPTSTSVSQPTATSVTSSQPTATSTPLPTPTRQAGNIGTVVSSALNVRTGPSTAFPIVRAIARGVEFTVMGQNYSGAWLFVRLRDGTEGWLARAYTNYVGIAPIVSSPKPPAPTPVPTTTRPPQGSGWRGEYYNNATLSGEPKLVRDDAKIDFDWGYGSPANVINDEYFSVRWVRSFYLAAGTYRFFVSGDDGVRVWINGEQIINEWHLATGRTYSVDKRVDSGSALVRVEFYEATQVAKLRFWWEPVEQQSYPDWRGEYYNDQNLTGSPAFVRNDNNINFDWGTGSPANNFRSNEFSVRWIRDVHFEAGTYRFHAVMDDGMRVYLDDSLIIDEWRNGSTREITRDLYVGYGTHRLRVENYEDTGYAVAKLWWERISDAPDDFPNWKGEYWDNRDLDGNPLVVRDDREIDFNWGSGSPDSRISHDNFSARWTRWVDFDDARYRFYAKSDDGIRVWVDDDRIIDKWQDNSFDTTYTAEIDLDGDERVKVEYFERTGGARVEVWWEKLGSSPDPTRIEPYVDAVPAHGPVGTEITVSGGGFPANARVSLYLGGLVQASAVEATSAQPRVNTTTSGSGTFSMKFTIPSTWPDNSPVDPGTLVLLVATDDFAVEASAVFEVTPAPISGGNPYAVVSPSSGGEDTRVTVSGGGFPGNSRVRAYLAGLVTASALRNDDDMEVYASTTTDALGNYRMTFDMPEEWPDNDDIETGKLMILVATDDFVYEASAQFNYFKDDDIPNVSIDVSPSSGEAGTTVRVSGSGFPANSEVNLYLGSLDNQVGGRAGDRLYASTNSDRRGNYDLAFTMPRLWPDGSSIPSGRVAIVVANSDFSLVVGGSFNFIATGNPEPTPTPTSTAEDPLPAPSANVVPLVGGAGTVVTVNGNGFPADVTLHAYLAVFGHSGGFAEDAVRYGSALTEDDGSYVLTLVLPEFWPNGDRIDDGRLLIVIATRDFGSQASGSIEFNSTSAASGALVPVEPTATEVPTETPLPTDTAEPTATETETVAPTAPDIPTNTPEPSEVPTEAATNTLEPTATPTEVGTNTPEPPATATEAPTNTSEPTATPTEVPTNTPEPPATATEVPTNTSEPPATATETPTNTSEPTATAAPTETPTETPVPEVEDPPADQQQVEEPEEVLPTETPTETPTPTLTPTEESPA